MSCPQQERVVSLRLSPGRGPCQHRRAAMSQEVWVQPSDATPESHAQSERQKKTQKENTFFNTLLPDVMEKRKDW